MLKWSLTSEICILIWKSFYDKKMWETWDWWHSKKFKLSVKVQTLCLPVKSTVLQMYAWKLFWDCVFHSMHWNIQTNHDGYTWPFPKTIWDDPICSPPHPPPPPPPIKRRKQVKIFFFLVVLGLNSFIIVGYGLHYGSFLAELYITLFGGGGGGWHVGEHDSNLLALVCLPATWIAASEHARCIHIISWEPEGHYHYSKMFRWEPEGHDHYSLFNHVPLRTRRALSLFKDVLWRTRRALWP